MTPLLTDQFETHTSYCSDIVETAIDRMRDAESLHPFHNIYGSMVRELRAAHCPQFNEVANGAQADDKIRLNYMLVEKALAGINNAPSGCMVDQSLRDLRHFQSQLCVRLSDDQRIALIDAVDQRTLTGLAESDPSGHHHDMWKGWRESCLRALGPRPVLAVPELSLAA